MAVSVPIYYNDNLRVYKNKKLNNADISVSAPTYFVFLHLISKITGVDFKTGEYIEPEMLVRKHTLTANEFSEVFKLDRDNTYKILKNATNQLMKSSIKLEKPDISDGEYWVINICSLAKYKPKQGLIEIEFTDSIMPYLAQVKENFVTYPLNDIVNFKSFYTTRLYELIMDFKDTGVFITSVDKLREFFAVGKKHVQYRDFKKNTIAVAVDEINRNYKINLSFEEIKGYRENPEKNKSTFCVTAIKFTYVATRVIKKFNPITGKQKNIYFKPKKIVDPSSQKTKSTRKLKIIQPQLELVCSNEIRSIEATKNEYLLLEDDAKGELSFDVLHLLKSKKLPASQLNKYVTNLENYSIALYAIRKNLPFEIKLVAEISSFLNN
jgi:plasmid replication initiation protein